MFLGEEGRNIMRRIQILIFAFAFMVIGIASAVAATLPLASFAQAHPKSLPFTYTNRTTSAVDAVISANTAVTFNFLAFNLPTGLPAQLTLSSSTSSPNNVQANGPILSQLTDQFTMQFIYTGPTQTLNGKVYTQNVSNLLTMNSNSLFFGGALILGTTGSTTPSIGGQDDGGGLPQSITYTSDYIGFAGPGSEKDFTLALTSLTDINSSLTGLHRDIPGSGTEDFDSFNSSISGNFGYQVPEPNTLMLLMSSGLGMGLAGFGLRRRRA